MSVFWHISYHRKVPRTMCPLTFACTFSYISLFTSIWTVCWPSCIYITTVERLVCLSIPLLPSLSHAEPNILFVYGPDVHNYTAEKCRNYGKDLCENNDTAICILLVKCWATICQKWQHCSANNCHNNYSKQNPAYGEGVVGVLVDKRTYVSEMNMKNNCK